MPSDGKSSCCLWQGEQKNGKSREHGNKDHKTGKIKQKHNTYVLDTTILTTERLKTLS
jgi:hypothetical protein